MSFIDNLGSIGANLGLSKLAPSNMDAVRDSYGSMARNNRDAKLLRNANRDARTRTDQQFLDKAQDSFDRAKLADDNGNLKRAEQHSLDMQTNMNISRRHQAALGRDMDGGIRDGSKLNDVQLRQFRDQNTELIRDHKKESKKAASELRGHAKDYFFSGDLGANAMRWGAAGAAYAGANVGMRTISGGSATTNNQGQRDIAGIPFF